MFQLPEIRSAITLILALGVAAPVLTANAGEGFDVQPVNNVFGGEKVLLAAAEGSVADSASDVPQLDKSKTKVSADAADVAAGSAWGGATSNAMFGSESGVGVSQQSAMAGYELGGSGVASGRLPTQGAILTTPTRGRPVRFDNGIFIYPSALIGFGRNDNLLGSQTNKQASNFTLLRPEVVTELKRGGDRYTFSYMGNYAHYNSATADDYDHHELWAAADNYFTSRLRLGWGGGYLQKSDPRGSTNLATSASPDRWHAPVVRVLGIYGAPGAIGRVELESSMMQKRYDNNRTVTAGSDVDISMVSGRFYYRFMPKTSLLLEARNTWSDYKLGISTQDNSDRRYYAGLTWEATAKTTGTIKLGRAYKNFDDGSRQDASSASWEASLRWAPLTYSSIDLVTSKAPSDATGLGNFVTNTATNLTWNHQWASYISSRLSAGLVKTDYAGVDRRDDTRNYGLGFYRELGYRLRLGLDWNRTDRGSNQSVNEFKRDVTMISIEGVL